MMGIFQNAHTNCIILTYESYLLMKRHLACIHFASNVYIIFKYIFRYHIEIAVADVPQQVIGALCLRGLATIICLIREHLAVYQVSICRIYAFKKPP